MSPYKFVANTCSSRTPECQKIIDAVKADAASAVRADANGTASFPGVAPGIYYLMVSTRYNNQALAWGQRIPLNPGPNSISSISATQRPSTKTNAQWKRITLIIHY